MSNSSNSVEKKKEKKGNRNNYCIFRFVMNYHISKTDAKWAESNPSKEVLSHFQKLVNIYNSEKQSSIT